MIYHATKGLTARSYQNKHASTDQYPLYLHQKVLSGLRFRFRFRFRFRPRPRLEFNQWSWSGSSVENATAT